MARTQVAGINREDLKRAIKQLERMRLTDRQGTNIVRGSLKTAMKPMLADSRRGASIETGELKRAHKLRSSKNTDKGWNDIQNKGLKRLSAFVEIISKWTKQYRRGFRGRPGGYQRNNPAKYAHLVEFGTKFSKAYPFMKPAFERNKDRAARNFGFNLMKRTEARLKRHVRAKKSSSRYYS